MIEIPLAPLERLMRNAGAPRVSESACVALRDILEEEAVRITQKAIQLARHAKRVTVTGDDIKLAR